ncbi:1-aminocyclopropane-1-carboxylate synthase-like [Impatiens glandulifera]|uniref:1-aminocyclopropane-1-carboxylate synthase-like n=1 Tax=Impatiens glandulifera TaxID=253017 RepID=UPI001FB149C9|nr:1-aminocyclopropane-1-carboxylate synthase-like [Impatiens glandulifera]
MVNQASSTLLSKMARSNGHGEESHYFDGWKAYESDPYHSVSNPNGVIQMGLAENQLCFDSIQEWIIKNPQASICSAEGLHDFKDVAIYQDYHGLPEFRNAVAKFMTRVRGGKVEFEPDRVVMSGGATGAQETLAFCLADSGDAFLVPTPYYPGFDRDLRWRTGIQLIPVTTKSSNGFKPDVETLQSAYDKATAEKISVKGLLLTNPSNPLGTVLDKESLRSILRFAQSNNIHLICDEIYAGTVSGFPDFISISEIIEEEKQHTNRNLIHIIYSLSKDLGFPGFRVGIIYSYNDEVVNCARKMSSFGLVSTQTQRLVATMLADDEFVNEFLERSANRLDKRRKVFAEELAKLGIGSLKGNAGLFLWMDLRGFLDEQSVEAEAKLWRVIINQVKLNVSPGSSFHCSEPGWFRVCIANMDDETVNASLTRIENFVAHSMAARKRKSLRLQKNLQVSLSFKRLQQQEALTMSPHSPISSPLVRART